MKNIFKLDVIVVSRNRPLKLLRCVSFLVSNNIPPKRIIIVDSSDKAKNDRGHDIMADSRKSIFNLIKQKDIKLVYKNINHHGISYARNVGLKNVKSEYFAFIDDDEIVPSDWMERVSRIFNEYKKIHVLCGPKKPSNIKNYWNKVWFYILKQQYNFIGKTYFVSAGNSIYKTRFIKSHGILFDKRMLGTTSEDSVMSRNLMLNKASILFHKDLYVYHDFRDSLFEFAKQWFAYGKGACDFHKYYFSTKPQQTSVQMLREITPSYRESFRSIFRKYTFNILLFGLIIKDVCYVTGWFTSFLFGDSKAS